ncbi:MAG TPA: hypothetical protein PKH07_15345, partial [bacterium]|nr:hypothetical protein [bacterium]
MERTWKVLLFGNSDQENRIFSERLRNLSNCRCCVDVVSSVDEASSRIAAADYDVYMVDYQIGAEWIASLQANEHQRATLFLIEEDFDPQVLAEDLRTHVFYIFKNRVGLSPVDAWVQGRERPARVESLKDALLFRSISRATDISRDFEMLRETEERYRKLVENAQDGIAIVLDQKILFV